MFVAYLIKLMGGRTAAFNVATFGWVLCGVLNLAIFFTIDKDERIVQSMVAADLNRIRDGPVTAFDEEMTNTAASSDDAHGVVPERTTLRRRSS